MAPEGAVRVDGGNWLIFALMAAKSGAHISLNTSVTALSLVEQKASSSPSDKYIVTTRSAESGIEENLPVAFDNIVVATPFQFSDIATSAHVIQATIDEIPYVKLHVTILSSPLPLSPAFFNLAATASVPGMILTTLGKNDNATSGSQGAGAAGFFSINVLRTVVNPATQRPEYLYKIFSPDAVSVEFLSRLFGVAVDEDQLARADASGTRRSGSQEGQQREDAADAARAGPVSWFFPAVFDSYPQALPRVTFQDPVVGAGVYYTSGMESFISTMETNALMGKNVARLIVDEILDAARTEMQAQAGNKKPGEDWTAAERQKVLGAGPPR